MPAAKDRLRSRSRKKKLTKAKACTIRREGEAHGKKLTGQQKKFFGAVCGGEKPRK